MVSEKQVTVVIVVAVEGDRNPDVRTLHGYVGDDLADQAARCVVNAIVRSVTHPITPKASVPQ